MNRMTLSRKAFHFEATDEDVKKKLKQLLCIAIGLLAVGRVAAQEDDAAAAAGGDDAAAGGEDGGGDECEEAWTYVEFLKTNVK